MSNSNFYYSPNNVWVEEFRGWGGWVIQHVCDMQEMYINHLSERRQLKDPGIGGRIILNWITSKQYEALYWIQVAQDKILVAVCGKHDKEPRGLEGMGLRTVQVNISFSRSTLLHGGNLLFRKFEQSQLDVLF